MLRSKLASCTSVSTFHARVRHQHIVFDPDAAPAREVCARLDREDHAGRDRLVARVDVGPPPRDPRILVHFDAEPWPVPWPNASPMPAPRQATSRAARVDGKPRRARADRRDRPIVGRRARRRTPRAPAASPARPRPSGSGRRSMSRRRRQSPAPRGRLRSIFARRAARAAARRSARWPRSFQTPVAESGLAHAAIDRERQFALGHSALDARRARSAATARESLARFSQHGDLVLVLHDPRGFDDPFGRRRARRWPQPTQAFSSSH